MLSLAKTSRRLKKMISTRPSKKLKFQLTTLKKKVSLIKKMRRKKTKRPRKTTQILKAVILALRVRA